MKYPGSKNTIIRKDRDYLFAFFSLSSNFSLSLPIDQAFTKRTTRSGLNMDCLLFLSSG